MGVFQNRGKSLVALAILSTAIPGFSGWADSDDNVRRKPHAFQCLLWAVNQIRNRSIKLPSVRSSDERSAPSIIDPQWVDQIRSKQIMRSAVKRAIIIRGRFYETVATLGTGQNVVFLARDQAGVLVSIKESIPGESFRLAAQISYPYEFYVSQYYAERRLPIARVLDYELADQDPKMVKEYVQGLTLNEIYARLPQGQVLAMEEELKLTIQKFKRARRGFLPWLVRNRIKLSSVVPRKANVSILLGDLEPKNFIYSAPRNEWVLIDP